MALIANFAGIEKWFRGRVVRQRSAKPCTAVQIRSEPLKIKDALFGVFFCYLGCSELY